MGIHEPWPLVAEIFEDVGGVLIAQGVEVQIRCGCEDSLAFDYGHENGAMR